MASTETISANSSAEPALFPIALSSPDSPGNGTSHRPELSFNDDYYDIASSTNQYTPDIPRRPLVELLEIRVADSERRSETATKSKGPVGDGFVGYLIQTRLVDAQCRQAHNGASADQSLKDSCALWRRYSEFELLRRYLAATYPECVIPPLPEKRVSHGLPFNHISSSIGLMGDKFDPAFVEQRRGALEKFILRVASDPTLSHDAIFIAFLQDDAADWQQLAKQSNFEERESSTFGRLTASLRVSNPNPEMEAVKNYGNELAACLELVATERRSAAAALKSVNVQHAYLGHAFSQWCALEACGDTNSRQSETGAGSGESASAKTSAGAGAGATEELSRAMGEALQKAGHSLDSLASLMDRYSEDDEQVDQELRELLGFGDALSSLGTQFEVLELEAEQTQASLAAKQTEVEKLRANQPASTFQAIRQKLSAIGQTASGERASGLGGSIGGLFREPPDVHRNRLAAAEDQLEALDTQRSTLRDRRNTFLEHAKANVERFDQMKVRELKSTLSKLSLVQIERCKKYVSVWSRLREAFEEVPLPQGLCLIESPSHDASGSGTDCLQHPSFGDAGEARGDQPPLTKAAPTPAPAPDAGARARQQQQQQSYPSAHEVSAALSNPQAHQRAVASAAAAATVTSAESSAQPTEAVLPTPAPVPDPDSSEC